MSGNQFKCRDEIRTISLHVVILMLGRQSCIAIDCLPIEVWVYRYSWVNKQVLNCDFGGLRGQLSPVLECVPKSTQTLPKLILNL